MPSPTITPADTIHKWMEQNHGQKMRLRSGEVRECFRHFGIPHNRSHFDSLVAAGLMTPMKKIRPTDTWCDFSRAKVTAFLIENCQE